jgi:hypothetical protein
MMLPRLLRLRSRELVAGTTNVSVGESYCRLFATILTIVVVGGTGTVKLTFTRVNMKSTVKLRVKLVDVRGDIEEYADIIGRSGELRLGSDGVGSFSWGSNEWLEFRRKRVNRKTDLIRVHTEMGNTFVFETMSLIPTK